MNVHIALIGRTMEPALKGYQYYGMDKLFLLHTQDTEEFPFKKTAEEVKRRLADVGFSNVFLVEINPFDMNNIIEAIVRIAENEKQASIYINITGGTNLMAGAACSATFFIGAKAYYVLDENRLPKGSTLEDQILELPTPKVPYARNLQKTQLKILSKLVQYNGTASNRQLHYELKTSPQKLSYNIRELETKGFVTTKRGWEVQKMYRGKPFIKVDRRILAVSITNAGRLVTSWTSTR
jgi:CRISPR locus-related DNA-binding protein